jgi:hypothetical protein
MNARGAPAGEAAASAAEMKKAAMQGIAAFMGVCWKRISRSC